MIKVDKDIIIEVDAMNYIAKVDKHQKDKKGKDVFALIGYYPNLDSALKAVLKYKIAKSLEEGEYSLKEAIRVVQEVKKEFGAKIDEIVGDN